MVLLFLPLNLFLHFLVEFLSYFLTVLLSIQRASNFNPNFILMIKFGTTLLSFLLLVSCKHMKPIEYAASRSVADSALPLLANGDTEGLKAIVHPDNWKRIAPEDLISLMSSSKGILSMTPSLQPISVDSTFNESYNLGGKIIITTYDYVFPNPENADSVSSILISVAKGKVIGITVSL